MKQIQFKEKGGCGQVISVREFSPQECEPAGKYSRLAARLGEVHFATLSLGLCPMVSQIEHPLF